MSVSSPQEIARISREETYRKHILDAAERLIGVRGLERTRMQDVAAEARTAVATIYRHYPTKQDLYAALVQRSAEGPFVQASSVVDPDRPPFANLMEFSLEIFRFMLEHPDSLRFALRTMPASWGLGEDIESWARMRDYHATLAQQCIDDGSIVGRDGRLVARLIGAILQVYLGDWLEHGDLRNRDLVTEELRAQLERAFAARR